MEEHLADGQAAVALESAGSFTHGCWIAPLDSTGEKNFYFRVRRKFFLTGVPPQAILRVGCESYYLLFLNGHEIGRGPARGTHSVNYFDQYPVSEFLQPGENIIAALCLCMNIETFIAAPAEPAFFASLAGVVATNESWETLAPGKEWKQDTPMEAEQTGFSEWRDFRHEPVGWTLGLDHAAWRPARRIEPSSDVLKKSFRARSIPFLQETEIAPHRVAAQALVPPMEHPMEDAASLVMREPHHGGGPLFQLRDGSLRWHPDTSRRLPGAQWNGACIIDFGRIVVGRVELEMTGEAGAIVDLAYAEEVGGQGRLIVQHVDPNGGRYNFADRFVLRSGRQRVGTCLCERGFRYVQITFRNFSGLPEIHRLRAVDRRYPYAQSAAFSCSDAALEAVWNSCVETISTCTTDTLIDCPWRERALWVNDLLVESTVSLQVFGDARICRRTLELAFSEALPNGLIPGVVPCPVDQKVKDWLVLPAGNLFLVPVVCQYLLYTGDRETVRGLLPRLQEMLGRFEDFRAGSGLIVPPKRYWTFFDWSYEAGGYSLNGKASAPLNYLYLRCRQIFGELQGLMGNEEEYRRICAEVRRDVPVVEAAFFDPARRRLLDFGLDGGDPLASQLTHALAVLVGATSGDRQQIFVEAIDDPRLLAPELFLHTFVFDALCAAGRPARGLDRIRKHWGGIARQSSTIWEFGIHAEGKAALGGIGSLCHGFSTAPVSLLQREILGVRPLEPGFRKFRFSPSGCGLAQAGGDIPTPRGKITVHWIRKGPVIHATLRVPGGCRALVGEDRILGRGIHEICLEAAT